MTLDAATCSQRASLIVLNFNGRDVITPCIASLVRAAGVNDEIIVVDNCSTDSSADLVSSQPGVRVVHLPENSYIFGLNAGLAKARGRYVAFLNNDIIVEPDFVDRCLARFADGDDVFAVCPRILQNDGGDQGSRTAGYWHSGLIFYRSLPHSDDPTDCFFAVGGQSFFRRNMLNEIGSLDPLLWPMYHEDIELSYRAWKRGWRIRYAPDAIVHHIGGHSSQRVFTRSQLRSFVRQNEYLTVWKNVTDRALLAQHVVLVPPRLAIAVARRDWPTLIGFGRAIRRVPRVIRARRACRSHARIKDREVLQRVAAIT